jgi:hypothetical protein
MIEAIPLQSATPVLGTPQKPQEVSSSPEAKRSSSPSSRAISNRIQSASLASSSFQSPKKPKVPSRQVSASPSPPNVPITTPSLPPRSPVNKRLPIEKYYDSPKLSSRSLSYEHLQKEKRIQNKLISLRESNELNSTYNPSPRKATTLFLSEKVAFNSSDGQETRKGRRLDESGYANLTSKSQEILNSFSAG